MSFSLLLLIIVLMVITILSALLAIQTQNLALSIIASSVVSLMASLFFVLLAAPDVAMTEAAIGSGLTTFIFFYALSSVRQKDKENI